MLAEQLAPTCIWNFGRAAIKFKLHHTYTYIFGSGEAQAEEQGSGITKDLWPWRLYNYDDGKVLLGFLVSVFGLRTQKFAFVSATTPRFVFDMYFNSIASVPFCSPWNPGLLACRRQQQQGWLRLKWHLWAYATTYIIIITPIFSYACINAASCGTQ